MAGLYLHIPFCSKACFYCDFHFSVNRKNEDALVDALLRELRYYGKDSETDFFKGTKLDTLYFGGGTPSILSLEALNTILNSVHKNFDFNPDPEVTLEANPENLSEENCERFSSLGINRLSIGIQSFYDHHLTWMNRSHRAEEAIRGLENAQKTGFKNLSADLIYGFDGLNADEWLANLETITKYKVDHLSCYALTVEKNTPLYKLILQGKYKTTQEEVQAEHFDILMQWAEKNGWNHYEVSNFCRENNFSRHNRSYWEGKPYLGIGPSAHSFDTKIRRWNVSDNRSYIEALRTGKPDFEEEILTIENKMNEYLLTGLRMKEGINLNHLPGMGKRSFMNLHKQKLDLFVSEGLMVLSDPMLRLSSKGKMFADRIACDFFV
ncbi:MAG: radical SAM family heme chaperone HemW [Flavobacteriales bacterium]|nr:radical SAM family heme chaperone HemW [Flavobacteriales bacterium]